MKLSVMLNGFTQIQKTVFEYLHPVTKEWRMQIINGFFEKENLEKQYFDEIKITEGTECSRTDTLKS